MSGKTPWEIAVDWYDSDSIERAIRNSGTDAFGAWPAIPHDVYSRQFAEWLTQQYRLAMAKGIQLGREGLAGGGSGVMFPGCYGDGKPKIESCIACCEPTGRAGKGEDSIYFGDVGPFCESCKDDIQNHVESKQQAEIERMRAALSGAYTVLAVVLDDIKEAAQAAGEES